MGGLGKREQYQFKYIWTADLQNKLYTKINRSFISFNDNLNVMHETLDKGTSISSQNSQKAMFDLGNLDTRKLVRIYRTICMHLPRNKWFFFLLSISQIRMLHFVQCRNLHINEYWSILHCRNLISNSNTSTIMILYKHCVLLF